MYSQGALIKWSKFFWQIRQIQIYANVSGGVPEVQIDRSGPIGFRCQFYVRRLTLILGPLAQSVEQRTFNPWVDGSSPSGPTFIPTPFSPMHTRMATGK